MAYSYWHMLLISWDTFANNFFKFFQLIWKFTICLIFLQIYFVYLSSIFYYLLQSLQFSLKLTFWKKKWKIKLKWLNYIFYFFMFSEPVKSCLCFQSQQSCKWIHKSICEWIRDSMLSKIELMPMKRDFRHLEGLFLHFKRDFPAIEGRFPAIKESQEK